jgi:hypothetical protein
VRAPTELVVPSTTKIATHLQIPIGLHISNESDCASTSMIRTASASLAPFTVRHRRMLFVLSCPQPAGIRTQLTR